MVRVKKCPICKVKLANELISNLAVKKLINASTVYCYTRVPALEAGGHGNAENNGSSSSSSSSRSSSGRRRNVRPRIDHCTWEGKLEDAVTHFHECGYAGVKCTHAGCDKVVARRDMAEHEATCLHRTERCGMCESLQKAADLAQHQLVCLKRLVACDNHGCGARVAFDELAAHKASDCGYEEVGCPFADMGCTARMLRKDIDSHEDAALKQHNRLLLGKAKEQQQINKQTQAAHDEQQASHEEVKQELEELKEAHEELKVAHDELQQELEELKGRVKGLEYEVITLRVRHAPLTGREPLVPLYPTQPTRLYSEEKEVQGHTVCIYADTNNDKPENQNYYGFHLAVLNGPFPCKVTCTWELVHHDGNPLSAEETEDEYTFTEAWCWGYHRFISKARLASPDNNPYVKDGYVTFKCTVKIVNQ
jgi:hypothetical protein